MSSYFFPFYLFYYKLNLRPYCSQKCVSEFYPTYLLLFLPILNEETFTIRGYLFFLRLLADVATQTYEKKIIVRKRTFFIKQTNFLHE